MYRREEREVRAYLRPVLLVQGRGGKESSSSRSRDHIFQILDKITLRGYHNIPLFRVVAYAIAEEGRRLTDVDLVHILDLLTEGGKVGRIKAKMTIR